MSLHRNWGRAMVRLYVEIEDAPWYVSTWEFMLQFSDVFFGFEFLFGKI